MQNTAHRSKGHQFRNPSLLSDDCKKLNPVRGLLFRPATTTQMILSQSFVQTFYDFNCAIFEVRDLLKLAMTSFGLCFKPVFCSNLL